MPFRDIRHLRALSVCWRDPANRGHLGPAQAHLTNILARHKLISQKVFIKAFCKSQFPHKSVNLRGDEDDEEVEGDAIPRHLVEHLFWV